MDVKTGKKVQELATTVQACVGFRAKPTANCCSRAAPRSGELDTGKPRWQKVEHAGRNEERGPVSFRADGKTFWAGLSQWDATTGKLLGGVSDQVS